jgi:hypothetical protein
MLMLATALHAGCTFTYRRPRPATPEQLQAQIAQDATSGDPVTMLPALSSTTRRPPPTGMPPHVDPTLLLSNRAATAPVSVVDVVSPGSMPPRGYEVKRRMSGAWEGLAWGLLGGAATCAAIGYFDGDDPSGFISFSAGEKAAMGGIAGAVVGGALGALSGAIIGHTDRYLF